MQLLPPLGCNRISCLVELFNCKQIMFWPVAVADAVAVAVSVAAVWLMDAAPAASSSSADDVVEILAFIL